MLHLSFFLAKDCIVEIKKVPNLYKAIRISLICSRYILNMELELNIRQQLHQTIVELAKTKNIGQ